MPRTSGQHSLSPWTQLQVVYRAQQGEPTGSLAQEFGVSQNSISRWRKLWGKEAYKVRVQHATEDIATLAAITKKLVRQVSLAAKQMETLERRFQRNEYSLTFPHNKAEPVRAVAPLPHEDIGDE